jgi:integrase
MPTLKFQLPKYSKLSDRNQAYYNWKGKKHRLPGKHGSKESRDAYDLDMAKLLEARASDTEHIIELQNSEINNLTVADLVALRLADGKTHYVKNGRATGTVYQLKNATKLLLKMFGNYEVKRFTQKELNRVIAELQKQKKKNGNLISVQHVNTRREKIISIFNWGYSEGYISKDISEKLTLSKKVAKHRSPCPSTVAKLAVPDEDIKAILKHLTIPVRDMVLIQRFSGCRTYEVRLMRFNMIDQITPEKWVYVIPAHETRNGKKPRFIKLGKRCIEILSKYIDIRKPNDIIFSSRKTVNKAYRRDSYRNAIIRACKAAKISQWTPAQLRKRGLTEVAQKYGEKVAQAVASHSSVETTKAHYLHQFELACNTDIEQDFE